MAAAIKALSQIGKDNAEYIISSDSLACLMTIKNMCLIRGQTARYLARTKEARILIPCQKLLDHINQRKCDVTLHHEQPYHEREKRKTRDTARALPARLNHANDLLAGQVTEMSSTQELDFCGSSIPDLEAPPHFRRQGSPLYGDIFQQIGNNAYHITMDRTLRTCKSDHYLCLRSATFAKNGDVDLAYTNKARKTLHSNLQAEMIRDCMGLLSSSTFELSHAVGCTDGEKIRRMARYMKKNNKNDQNSDHTACPSCCVGQDPRHHWRFIRMPEVGGHHETD